MSFSTAGLLPSDIILRILHMTFDGFKDDVYQWQLALSYLAICQRWRNSLYKSLYSCAIAQALPTKHCDCCDHKHSFCNMDSNNIAICSNLGLIAANYSLVNVRRLVVNDATCDRGIDLLQCLVTALSLEQNECPNLSLLKQLFCDTEQARGSLISLESFQAREIAAELVLALAKRMPNISNLTIEVSKSHNVLSEFATLLTHRFVGQLTKLKYSGMAHIPTSSLVECRVADLQLSINIDDDRTQPSILVYPKTLCKLSLQIDKCNTRWNFFSQSSDVSNKNNVFDNLTTLRLAGDKFKYCWTDEAYLRSESVKLPQLEFPKLNYLIIDHTSLNSAERQSLLRAPLKQINYHGLLKDLLVLCRQDISGLDELSLKLSFKKDRGPDASFIGSINELFKNIGNIKVVHWEIDSNIFCFDINRINWPHLTHLTIRTAIRIDMLFKIIDAVPNLNHLSLHLFTATENAMEKDAVFLDNLKQDYPVPSASKIKTLTLHYSRFMSHEYVAFLQIKIQWFLPLLETVVVQGKRRFFY
ncbi:hypothetical protein COEREDRAFT_83335 [Coemansia reversa NRRL 1564]|uniref:F-box domain-containing protein n=1 Tax=Coemansia reversa (strain ATCC 12441 / NRRL 1564) TaxID=763665 RepID=A0A2G5B3N6_COERN|nr:hypothetical protein COEREDRAFT_83335 [Coemansia reversa NRRL 1564]|eukprot:PIA13628.1 hypothetical protein COEREDRAFT_83335 [Coemansia reversa NRRL 1564]